MKKQILIIAALAAISNCANAQLLRGLSGLVKAKAEQRVAGEVDKKIGQMFSSKKKAKETEEDSQPASVSSPKAKNGIKSYSKFDFVPGEKIIYIEDFLQAPLGELPLGWNASGKGEVVSTDGYPGKWLRLFPGSMYLSGNTKPFGENYTIEFDVMITGTPPSGTRFLPDLNFGLLATGKVSATHNSFLNSSATINNQLQILIKPNVDQISTIQLETTGQAKTSTFKSANLDIPKFGETIGSVAHYAIQVQKQRFRMWINEDKIFDVPQAVNLTPVLNQLYFKPSEHFRYNESNFGLYISNFKVASGKADNRSKLITEGKLSTTGILFETGSSTISPQSYGVLKQIGQALAENTSIRFRVTGYTDNNGDAKKNLELSVKRAEAVCKYLAETFKINEKTWKRMAKVRLFRLAITKRRKVKP